MDDDPFHLALLASDALGDPNRRAIVELLGGGDRSVGEMAAELPISRPTVSRHLRLFKEAGLVVDQAEGTRRLYSLHDEGIEAVRHYLTEVWGGRPPASGSLRRAPRPAWSRLTLAVVVDQPEQCPGTFGRELGLVCAGRLVA